MPQSTNERILDAQITHAIQIERYKNATIRKAIPLIDQAQESILARLASEDLTDFNRARLSTLLENLQIIVRRLQAQLGTLTAEEAAALAEMEAKFQAQTLARATHADLINQPTVSEVVATAAATPINGSTYGELLDQYGRNTARRINQEIRIGVLAGESTNQILQRIRGTRAAGYTDGVLQYARREAKTLVRTAINHYATQTREVMFQSNAHLIKAEKWVSTLDGRTSPICRALDGKILKPGEGIRPPAHPNCRSITVPILKHERSLTPEQRARLPERTRASMDGQVPADLTYERWLKGKDAPFQRNVLGDARYTLWKKGKLSLDKFVNNAGKTLTLVELERSFPQAWQAAGL